MHLKHPGSGNRVAAMTAAAGSLLPRAAPAAVSVLAIDSINGSKAGYVLWRATPVRNFVPERP